jgi:hypothetical protein
MSESPIDLYERLPAVYRRRDAENGYPLRALLEIISEQAEIVKHDIEGFLDNFFIQTSDEWAIPYIGDLVDNEALHEVVQRRRADVAKTIYYRRRKGTLPMIEEIARDVTGWGAHAVEFFELMEWTQNLNHLRFERTNTGSSQDPPAMDRVGTVNLRNRNAVDQIDGPFDVYAHSADIRPTTDRSGWHNIPNIGIFLWRLNRYEMRSVPARPSRANDYGYYFRPLGHPMPLFTNPEREVDPTGLATERHVPAPIRPMAFGREKQEYYGRGAEHSLLLTTSPKQTADAVIPPGDIVCMDLETWSRPPKDKVGIDVGTGRIAFGANYDQPDQLFGSYNYGFSAEIGGGPYDRRERLTPVSQEALYIVVAKEEPDQLPDKADHWRETVTQALQDWHGSGADRAIIEILDNRVYGTPGTIDIDKEEASLEIRADNRKRPVIRGIGHLNVEAKKTGTQLILSGLVVEGRGLRFSGGFETIAISDTTLVPGLRVSEDGTTNNPNTASIRSDNITRHCMVTVDRSIVGPVILDADRHTLSISDSIVDAPEPAGGDRLPAIAGPVSSDAVGPPVTIKRSTVFGAVDVQSIPLASEVIFTEPVTAARRQNGCIRFSYVPVTSQAPRRYRCQPDLTLKERAEAVEREEGRSLAAAEKRHIRRRLQPVFSSTRYGQPAYAQLSQRCAEQIRTGGEDGSEMGAFNLLHQPQRETNLRIRLREYLPFGLDPGIIYVT